MQVHDTFFASLPGGKGLFWPMFGVSTLAAIVASQALISATFAIVSQVGLENSSRHTFYYNWNV